MKKFLVVLVAIAVVLAIIVNLSFVQDRLFSRLAFAAMQNSYEPSPHLQAYVCGTASPLGNTPNRAQACIAIITPEHFFVFDVGLGSAGRLQASGLPLNRIDGVFLTHFHSDHIADLPELNLNSWVAGRQSSLRVLGPEGVSNITAGLNQAYADDYRYRTAHHGEALLPSGAGPLSPQSLKTGVVFSDDTLSIRMFPVNHDPVEPAVGYALNYRGRTLVISGDSTVTDTLFEVARGVDVLFHDALAPKTLDTLINAARQSGRDRLSQIMEDVKDYHADVSTLEQASAEAGVDQLILYHLVPTPGNWLVESSWQREVSENTLIAHDGLIVELPTDSDEILFK